MGDCITCLSHTGVIFFIKLAPMFCYSKGQATIESSTFGSEVVVTRTCLKLVNKNRYKLKIMGVPVDGPLVFLGDNMSAVNGASIP